MPQNRSGPESSAEFRDSGAFRRREPQHREAQWISQEWLNPDIQAAHGAIRLLL
jgi:hypothetical protein